MDPAHCPCTCTCTLACAAFRQARLRWRAGLRGPLLGPLCAWRCMPAQGMGWLYFMYCNLIGLCGGWGQVWGAEASRSAHCTAVQAHTAAASADGLCPAPVALAPVPCQRHTQKCVQAHHHMQVNARHANCLHPAPCQVATAHAHIHIVRVAYHNVMLGHGHCKPASSFEHVHKLACWRIVCDCI